MARDYGWVDPPGYEKLPAEAWHYEDFSLDHLKEQEMKLNDHPYLDASRIILTEEYLELGNAGGAPEVFYTKEWTASIASSSYALDRGLKNYGPRVEATRKGKSAEEAYTALVAALTEQGWIVE